MGGVPVRPWDEAGRRKLYEKIERALLPDRQVASEIEQEIQALVQLKDRRPKRHQQH